MLAFISPRLALVALWLFSDILSRVVRQLVPAVHRVLPPAVDDARLAVMWDVGTREVSGFEWFVVGLAFLVDLASYFGGKRASRLGPRARSGAARAR